MTGNPSSTHLSKQILYLANILVPHFQVDTVGLRFPECPWTENIPKGWTEQRRQHIRCGNRDKTGSTHEPRVAVMFTNEETGLRVGGTQHGGTWAEFSVPRLFNGNNTILINSEERFGLARETVNTTIAEVCPLFRASEKVLVKRLDPVVYIDEALKNVIAAHRASRHPKFHKKAAQWLGESLVFKGRYRMCRMYSSDLLRTGIEGASTRVEWQLREPALSQDFGHIVTWANLTLEETYRVLRTHCLAFDCSEIAAVTSIYHFLAVAELNNWMHDGIPALELYLHGKKPSSVHRIRRKVASLRPSVFKFLWRAHLPPTLGEYLKRNGLL